MAHKLGFSKWGLRFAFIIGALFYGVTILIYIICWMVFKPRPTFNR
jgi:phage shock protein PspC (stress-responsive transcriptional regulator)